MSKAQYFLSPVSFYWVRNLSELEVLRQFFFFFFFFKAQISLQDLAQISLQDRAHSLLLL